MFRASSCPSSGKKYKADNAYGVQHWPCCRRLEEKRWFGLHLLGLVSRLVKPIPRSAYRTLLLMMGMMMFETCWDTNKNMSMEHWLNENDRKSISTWRKTCPYATSSATNLTWIVLLSNLGSRGDRPVTNSLNHDTARVSWFRRSVSGWYLLCTLRPLDKDTVFRLSLLFT
jgi:hypothetical protein